MPRGKKTVYSGYCVECNAEVGHVRISKSKKADFRTLKKFCPQCGERKDLKLKETKHSS